MFSSSPAASSQPTSKGPGRPKSAKPVVCSCPDLATQLIMALQNPLVVNALRSALLSDVTALLSDVTALFDDKINQMEGKIKELSDKVAELSTKPKEQPAIADAAIVVHLELEEKKKRASNVIVRGLAPRDDVADDVLFSQFMDANMTVKPPFVRSKCRRLGEKVSGRIQPLLVVFESTLGAADVLASSANLNQTCPGVFINPDLTKAEAQVAYQMREQRRQRRRQLNNPIDSTAKVSASSAVAAPSWGAPSAQLSTSSSLLSARVKDSMISNLGSMALPSPSIATQSISTVHPAAVLNVNALPFDSTNCV